MVFSHTNFEEKKGMVQRAAPFGAPYLDRLVPREKEEMQHLKGVASTTVYFEKLQNPRKATKAAISMQSSEFRRLLRLFVSHAVVRIGLCAPSAQRPPRTRRELTGIASDPSTAGDKSRDLSL